MNKPDFSEIEARREELIKSHNERMKSTTEAERMAALESFCGAFSYLMKRVVINEKEYQLSKTVWEHLVQMHPVRSVEALASNLMIVFGTKPFTSEDIEKLIEDEYKVQTEILYTLEQARKQASHSVRPCLKG
ncbi:MAG: hypothetical protein IJ794_14915 [Lachnospiraceae bacterium]|nr:hypothetical protein [Lachnospiraceae bacterium]